MADLIVGSKFNSYADFEASLTKFSQENFVQFYKRDCKTLEKIGQTFPRIARANKKLVYYTLKMCCIHGGRKFKKDPRSKNIRETRTFRLECPSNVTCCLSKCQQFLVVTKVNMLHNHPVSKELFKRLPQQRSLPPEVREKVASMMKMNVDRKQLRESLALKLGKVVLRTDLHNIARAYNNRSNTQLKTKKKMPLSYDEKFLQISSITEKINDVVSQCSGEDYERNKKLLEDILRIFLASAKSESSVSNHDKPSKSLQIPNEIAVESCSSKLVASQVESFSSVQISQPIHKTDCLKLLHMPLNEKICGVSDLDGISNTSTKSKVPVFCHNEPSENLQTENRSVVEGCKSDLAVSQVDLSSVQVSQPIQKTESSQLLHTSLHKKISRFSDFDRIFTNSTKSESTVFHHDKPSQSLQTSKKAKVESCNRKQIASLLESYKPIRPNIQVSQSVQKTKTEVIFVGSCRNPANGMKIYLVK